jgi:prepilin-type N-terminal cleavage/methylation domain-containing protein
MSWLRRRRAHDADEGVTLVEMLVATMIFSIILGIITTAIVAMVHQEQKESGQTNDLDAARKVIENLDHSVRYANAITTPGTGTDGSFYVEWQSGNIGQQQTCTQWRYVPSSGAFQWRTWEPPLSGVGTVTAGSWATEAIGLSPVGSTPVFSIAPTSSSSSKEELDVTFKATSGAPATTSASQVSLTAINSTSSSAPTGANAVCTQVGRP